ncbi:ABC transporter substrate-binding protein [Actinomadura geliboluensis]|uniref:Amino acid ABC transporter substrate-binding protein n=1 Tax=Actinomadura geliboluensis TaxID=882440 RepID=A0A5S4H7C0_9ACTN|nr:ABC transporter substrate-binding protein [Actinomadura geliboluensis]TMR40631.1 amino acid ABC transporter substrate-binding protein [Actinomadura geliboluensis]
MHTSLLKAGAVVAVLALAACGGGGTGASGAGKTLKFAVVAEESGPLGAYGSQLVAGVKAAVADLNASGSYDFKIEPVYFDCQSEQAICVAKARQAVTTDRLPLVMGPIVTANVMPAAEVTSRAKVPHIVMSLVSEITSKYDNTYRWGIANQKNNETVVEYVKSQIKPDDSVAIVHANSDFGNSAAGQQKALLDKAGIKISANIGHDPGQADYTPAILQLRKADPAYVLLSDTNPADVAKLLRQAKETGLKGQWIGAEAAGVIPLAGDAAKGYMTVAPWFPDNASDPNSPALTRKFKEQGVQAPGWFAGMAYDATKGIAEAARAQGFSSKELTMGLSSISDLPGTAVRSWTFSAGNHEGQTAATIAEWTGSGYRTVWPKP